MTSSASDRPAGLRERKKAKTRAAVQRHALRLFGEQGYAATTVDQIAAAAEISPSTFFRYFPSKEATVVYDELDPVLMRAAKAQPPELSATAALRATLREVFGGLSPEAWERERERQLLVFNEPELRAAVMEQYVAGIQLLADVAAERAGRSPDDFEVRNWAGAVVGVLMSAFLSSGGSEVADHMQLLDDAFAHLEAGLPL
ncbi:acyl-CoA-like ligand-binding transcription factor [Amycolatopsis sp. H20-H5]|uniref:acyl-CoA-like ligand-binding transcription factor n=1 Tax=Amycolatopsis sp. H20-H5 TaxID=3046309 RepID=UPI002DBE45CC|nr:TetR family transcriptional regulator [Amycolatopsis sp. H20-H5]MEC3975062.1 TetR family transcriptional regulator [Amycolatopsis sp. H20-H5]